MKINLHKNARTTPVQRDFIQNTDQMSISELADRIGVSKTTIRRWKKSNFVFDKPHTPKKARTAMTPEQKILVIILRICLRLGLDDLQQVVQEFICPDCSRSGLLLNRPFKNIIHIFQTGLKKIQTNLLGYLSHPKRLIRNWYLFCLSIDQAALISIFELPIIINLKRESR